MLRNPLNNPILANQRLQHAPEFPPSINRERPPAAPESFRDVKAQYVEQGDRADAGRRKPAARVCRENLRVRHPDFVQIGGDRNCTGHFPVTAERNRKERHWKSPLESLAQSPARNELVKVIAGPGHRTAEEDAMLYWTGAAAHACCERVEHQPVVSERPLEIERE